MAAGALLHFTAQHHLVPQFSAELFFYILLPPIILESAYSLHNKVFLDNLGTILLYAVPGTAFNFLLTGALLVLTESWRLVSGEGPSPAETFLWASLISAVDPVAVLAIFGELGVNSRLYYLVFGESLLNDGVAVVFYTVMVSFCRLERAGQSVGVAHLGRAALSLVTVSGGGLGVGILAGLCSALLTRRTAVLALLEPLLLLGLAFLAYLTADLLGWSAILSLIACGLTQAHCT